MAVGSTAAHAGDYSSTTSSDNLPPNHLGTSVPSGHFNEAHDPEKTAHGDHHAAPVSAEKADGVDEDEEEDMDALIDDLESMDGQIDVEDEVMEAGGARPVAEELLQTDTHIGLSEAEVLVRRRKFGLNQMKEEKENLILKFLGYFIGPIQFVMEVRRLPGLSGSVAVVVHG